MSEHYSTQADASPQRWLNEGEVLRTTIPNAAHPKAPRIVISVYVVPKTLRLLGNEAEKPQPQRGGR